MKTDKNDKFKTDSELPAKAGKGVDGIVATDASAADVKDTDYSAPSTANHAGNIVTDSPIGERTKTYEAAKLVSGAAAPSMGAGGSTRAVTFGGGAGSIGTDISATTRADSVYKSDTRMGKRFDPITRKIDYVYPETVEVDIRRSKALAETSEKQGYRGNYYNQHTITNRCNGGAPAAEEFNRSVDLIGMDVGYFTDGQYNTARHDYGEYDFRSWDIEANQYVDPPVPLVRGNYMADTLHVRINNVGGVQLTIAERQGIDTAEPGDLVPAERDMSNRDLEEAVTRLAGDAALRSYNQLELDRLRMVDLAGNDSDPKFSPMGDNIVSATAVNSLLRDLEAFAGDNIAVSHRKLSHALAYQVNKVSKDGLRITGPMAEMLNGNIEGVYSTAHQTVPENLGANYAFRYEAWAQGGAGLWLAINDTLRKYTTKGKLLAMPQSFRNALSICEQNAEPFFMHDSLAKDIKHCELFSTIDRAYDPFLPIVMTDKLSLIHPFSIAQTFNSTEIDEDTHPADCHVPVIMNYHYENWRNKVTVPVYNFFAAGLLDYFIANAHNFWDAFTRAGHRMQATDILEFQIPIQSSTTSLSLWDLIVCSAVPFMVPHRQRVMVDIIKYAKDHGYPYTGLVGVKSANMTDSMNFSFSSIDEPLVSRIANPVDAIKVKFPEVFWTVDAVNYDDNPGAGSRNLERSVTVLPFYFSDAQFTQQGSEPFTPVLNDNPSVINYPSTRAGTNLKDMDTVYGMTEEDYRLALDRMVVYPGYSRRQRVAPDLDDEGSSLLALDWITEGENHAEIFPCYSYKYSLMNEGIPALPYIAAAQSEDDYDRCLTIADVMQTPREIGLHFVVPSGILTPIHVIGDDGANYRSATSGYLCVSGPGFTAYSWHAAGTHIENEILQPDEVNMDASAVYKYEYQVFSNIPGQAQYDLGFLYGISRNISKANSHTYVLDGGSLDLVPFTEGAFAEPDFSDVYGYYADTERAVDPDSAEGDHLSVITLQKYMWPRLQRLPFVINPFDANASDMGYSSTVRHGNKFEIFDFLYYHDFCGFRGSDYNELTFIRNKMRIALGMNYVRDPYTDKTLLLK